MRQGCGVQRVTEIMLGVRGKGTGHDGVRAACAMRIYFASVELVR